MAAPERLTWGGIDDAAGVGHSESAPYRPPPELGRGGVVADTAPVLAIITKKEKSMTTEKLIEALQGTFGLAELERDEDGSVALTIDENLGARFFPLPSADDGSGAPARLVAAVILGPIGMFPPSAAVELLSANYLWESSAGGSFALDEGTGMVVLQRLFSPGEIEDSDAFVDDVAYLVGAARAVRQQIGMADEAANPEERLRQGMTRV